MTLPGPRVLSGDASAPILHFHLPIGLVLLLSLLLAPKILASPTLHDKHGKATATRFQDDDSKLKLGAGPSYRTSGSEDGCRGWFDLCCHSSVTPGAHHGQGYDFDQTWVGKQGGAQKPLTAASHHDQADSPAQHHHAETSAYSSAYLKEVTVGFFRPLLALAVGAWCASSAPTTKAPAHDSEIATSPSTHCPPRNAHLFPSFSKVAHIFSFGDSYTSTDFEYTDLPFPCPESPLGNPPYPGRTSANGPNWIDYLTTKYNHSFIKTYNIAAGGATANPEVMPPGFPSKLTLRGQILDSWLKGYSYSRGHGHDGQPKAPGHPVWLSTDSLFSIWMGINDVNGGFIRGPWGPGGTDALNKRTFDEYESLLDILYDVGARNFVLLNVPAIERSPGIRRQGDPAVALATRDLKQFNKMMRDMAKRFKAKHENELNVFFYDVYTDWNTVVDHPASFPQTAGLKNTMGYCVAYQFGTPTPDYFDPACGIPANQYLWFNELHPTDRIHELVAARVSQMLVKGDQNIC